MAAKKPRKLWGAHTRAYRNRIAQQAQEKYGLSRRSTREMYNRGTFKPGARNAEDRIPAKIRKSTGGRSSGLSDQELRDAVYRKLDSTYRDELKWTTDAQKRVRKSLDRMDRATLNKILNMDGDKIRDLASFQSKSIANRSAPKDVLNTAWKDDSGNYHNVFWYH